MKRKVSIVFLCIICLFLITSNVVYADSVDNFIKGDNDLLVLATITDIVDNNVVIEPFSCFKNRISGTDTVLPDTVTLNKFRYYYCNEHAENFNIPKIGDNIVISLGKNLNSYYIKNGVYKTDTVDVKNIRVLVPISAKGEDCEGKLVSLSYFISTGGSYDRFVYQNGIVKVNENNAEVTLYPSVKNTEKLITYVGEDGKEMSSKEEDVITGGINLTLDKNEDMWIYAIITIFVGLIFGFVVMWLLNKLISRKNNKA